MSRDQVFGMVLSSIFFGVVVVSGMPIWIHLYKRYGTELGRLKAKNKKLGDRIDRIERRALEVNQVADLKESIEYKTKRLAELAYEKPEHFND